MLHVTVTYSVGPVSLGTVVFAPPDQTHHFTETLDLAKKLLRRSPSRSRTYSTTRPPLAPSSEVSATSIRAKSRVSGAHYYGEGTWDKIPYTLEISAEVTVLLQDSTEAQLTAAQDLAARHATAATLRLLPPYRTDLLNKIETVLFKELFDD